MAGGGDTDNTIQLEGATDGTDIGNVADRLKVDAALNEIPQLNKSYKASNLTNSGSRPMNVNGSVTPVNFTYTPAQTEYLTQINILLVDVGTWDATDFASGTALTTGLVLKIRTQGTEYTFYTFQNNIDLSIASMRIWAPATTGGFLALDDAVMCTFEFRDVVLDSADTDYVRFTVNDNLTSIDQAYSTAITWRSV